MADRKSKPGAKTASNETKEQDLGGRPRVIGSPEEMQTKADAYFAECVTRNKPPTMAGLCYALGFSERHALAAYEKYDGFSTTVKRLRLRIEQDRSESLIDKTTFTPGQIFDLKNNHGWVDKQEVEHSGNIGIMDRINRARNRR